MSSVLTTRVRKDESILSRVVDARDIGCSVQAYTTPNPAVEVLRFVGVDVGMALCSRGVA